MSRSVTLEPEQPPRRPSWLAVRATGLAILAAAATGAQAQTVTAAGATASAGLGPWLFGSVALILVAALAWWAGRASAGTPGARPDRAAEPAAPDGQRESPAAAAAPADTPPQATDPGPSPGPATAAAPATGANGWIDEPPSHAEAQAFSYALSHDLRAPLRVVEGFTRILKEDYGRQLDRIGNDHLERMLGAAARMNAMIDAMLSVAQLSAQPLALQPVNLSRLATEILGDLRQSQPDRWVELEIAPDLIAQGDPLLLRQVLENLLGNAWKYSARAPKAQIRFTACTDGGTRVFEVADNGAGFDMRSAGRLFGLFQRLHSQSEFPGTGVGLASVQRIVQRHGGRIWADSEPGQGARFRFTLG